MNGEFHMIALHYFVVLCCVLTTVLPGQEKSISPQLKSLVDAERMFARRCSEKGIRESFIEFFADSSVIFRPHPINGKKFYLGRPVPPTLPPVRLEWAPIFADVSNAVDLGYTTGPSVFSDLSSEKKPPQFGAYFSIWKKQKNGAWKVYLDAGLQTSKPTASLNDAFVSPATDPRPFSELKAGELKSRRETMESAELNFELKQQSAGPLIAYREYIGVGGRMHRNGRLPLVGSDAILASFAKAQASISSSQLASDIAQSADLGFTYGSYEASKKDTDSVPEHGYFVRVWKLSPDERWHIVFDTALPIPAEIK
jgi:ketosteroid isomerase-like protein